MYVSTQNCENKKFTVNVRETAAVVAFATDFSTFVRVCENKLYLIKQSPAVVVSIIDYPMDL